MLNRVLIVMMLSLGLISSAFSQTTPLRSSMPTVTMYSTATCPYCKRARELLHQKNVTFTDIRIDDHPEKRAEMISKSHRHTVPQIFINNHPIGGCDDLYALDADGRLDQLLK